MSIALIIGTALTATSDTRNCWMLYLYLKQQAKIGKRHHRPSNKKRKIYKNNNKLDNFVGLITHFGIMANNNTSNLLHT